MFSFMNTLRLIFRRCGTPFSPICQNLKPKFKAFSKNILKNEYAGKKNKIKNPSSSPVPEKQKGLHPVRDRSPRTATASACPRLERGQARLRAYTRGQAISNGVHPHRTLGCNRRLSRPFNRRRPCHKPRRAYKEKPRLPPPSGI